MTLQLRNSLGDRLEEFRPAGPGPVRLYHCGPTVKEPAAIDRFRSYLLADVLRRVLEARGHSTRQVMNITDVGHLNEFEEDSVEVAAARRGLHAWEHAEAEEKAFHLERRGLGILDAHHYPRARDHVGGMIEWVRALEEKGLCYSAGGHLCLDVSRFPEFGKLCGRTREALEEALAQGHGTRLESISHRRHPLDIDLWRTDAHHELDWQSPWGRGFPGWHVECAAMARSLLDGAIDIHTGCEENRFPHHESEIAQAELLDDAPLARYWLHTAGVRVDGTPMARRAGNVVTVRELLRSGVRGRVIRVALLWVHYREELEFGETLIGDAACAVNDLVALDDHLRRAEESRDTAPREPRPAWIEETDRRFRAALDADLDYGAAIRAVLDTVRSTDPASIGDPRELRSALREWDRVLGVLPPPGTPATSEEASP